MTISLKKKVRIKTKMRTAEQEQRYIRICNNLNKDQEIRVVNY